MPPTPPAPGRVRPADVVNEAIRAVVRGARNRGWTQAERALYGELRDEWMSAVQADMASAA
ncbi:hypothetical protein [Streptomyces sp. NPDC091215]|uniref:hypothetical protein n=1 Tax=Streptomyces sp. NPDC091215 TaxID=3155192 RepID=UPI00342FFA48